MPSVLFLIILNVGLTLSAVSAHLLVQYVHGVSMPLKSRGNFGGSEVQIPDSRELLEATQTSNT